MSSNNWSNGREGFSLGQNCSNRNIFCNNLLLDSENIILDFWYQNSDYPNDSSGNIGLYKDDIEIIGLYFSYYGPKVIFNGQEKILNKEIPSKDDIWHHIVLSYDSFNHVFSLVVDGEEVFSELYSWPIYIPNSLKIIQNNFSYRIDDIKIIQGNLD